MGWADAPPDAEITSSWDSQPPDAEVVAPQSLASRLFSSLERVASLPVTFHREQFGTAKSVLQSGIASDKNFPAENLLPPAGGVIGAITGQEIPLPFASTFLSGIGSAIGEKARQGVRFLRGKPQDEGTALKEGIMGAASELGGAAAFKVLGAAANKVIARTGLTKFADKVSSLLKPTQLKEADKLFETVKTKPVSSASDTLEFVQDFLESRGITYKPSAEAIRRKMQSEALSSTELTQMNEELINASAPKLVSDLKTPVLKEYEPMANILDDLANPDLSYGQLKQIQERVGDLANFGRGERTTAERVYGKIYNKVAKDLDRTAKEGGFEKAHSVISDQRRKVIQTRVMQNIIEESKISDASGERLDFSQIARNLNMTDSEIKMVFGSDSDTVMALKSLATEYAGRFAKGEAIHPFISGSGNVGATARVGFLSRHLKSPVSAAESVFRRQGGKVGVSDIFPAAKTVRRIRSGLFQGGRKAIPDENK